MSWDQVFRAVSIVMAFSALGALTKMYVLHKLGKMPLLGLLASVGLILAFVGYQVVHLHEPLEVPFYIGVLGLACAHVPAIQRLKIKR